MRGRMPSALEIAKTLIEARLVATSRRNRNRKAEAWRLAERAAAAAEVAAAHAGDQAASARRQSRNSRVGNRLAKWAMIVAAVAAIGAMASPLIINRIEKSRETQRTFEAQIEIEVAIAERMRDAIDGISNDLGPASDKSPEDIRRLAQSAIEEFEQIDRLEREHELTQDRDSSLADVYLTRRQLFARVRRMLVGAVAQAEHSAAHAEEPGHHSTVNWVFSATNATMALNRYVNAIQVAADAKQVTIPDNLWIISPTFMGPMLDDAM